MDALRDLLACPICGRALAISWQCERCGVRYTAPDGIPNLRLGGDARTDAVRRFYERAPFPGYGPRDSLSSLCARAERSKFARLLNEAIPGDARKLDRKSTRLNSSHSQISYAVFCLKKKKKKTIHSRIQSSSYNPNTASRS